MVRNLNEICDFLKLYLAVWAPHFCADWNFQHMWRILNNEHALETDSAFWNGLYFSFLMLYLDQSLAGKNSWELASLDMVVNSPRFPVFDLVKGKQYCFRVRSVNKYGVSEPSEPSELISLGTPPGERVGAMWWYSFITLPVVKVNCIL